jgi:hypothetical protein
MASGRIFVGFVSVTKESVAEWLRSSRCTRSGGSLKLE